MIAVVALDRGVRGPVYGPDESGAGPLPVPVDRPPRTGNPLTGEETKALLCDIAPLFLPLRTLGWDVAITPDRPVIIEANGCATPG